MRRKTRHKSSIERLDPRVKQAIAKLEQVDDLSALVTALENISVSALATLTEERK